MKTIARFRRSVAIFSVLAAAAAGTILASASSPRFYDDDPVWVERDTQDAAGMKPLEISLLVDLGSNILNASDEPSPVRAKNLNTVDEVPDSSWFTNRAGHIALTP